MSDEKPVNPDDQPVVYRVNSLGADRWFVDSTKGTTGYSFHTGAEAERFAIALAKKNPPSKVWLLDEIGEVVTEIVFDKAADGNETAGP